MVPDPSTGPSAGPSADLLADRLAASLESWPRSTIRADELMAEMIRVSPELATASGRFSRLGEAVGALARTGVVAPTKTVVYRQGVGLPSSCKILRPGRAAPARPAISHPWVPLLSWCAERSWPDPAAYEQVAAINAWLARHPTGAPVVPVRERSLEVIGDDKALDRLLRGPLGRPEIVTALAVRFVHPPMATEEVPGATGRGVLVVENGTPFHSVLDAARSHAAAGRSVAWRWIGYGAGGQLGAILPSLGALEPDRLAYFGDLDPDGLEIAARGDLAARACGLGRLPPHRGLYEALLAVGRPQRNERRRPWPGQGMVWLGRAAAIVEERLGSDFWLAQEWIGVQWLTADTSWLNPVVPGL